MYDVYNEFKMYAYKIQSNFVHRIREAPTIRKVTFPLSSDNFYIRKHSTYDKTRRYTRARKPYV